MHDEPRRILSQLLIRYGVDLHSDPRRTEALLRDLAPGYAREIFVLVNAQKQRVPADLLAAPNWLPQQALHAQLVRRLEEQLALTPAAAAWAVETWAAALHTQPTGADQLWRRLRQYMLTAQKLRNWPARKWRQFAHTGVQYRFETLQRVWRTLAVTGKWLWSRRTWLLQTPVLLIGALVITLYLAAGAVPPLTPIEPLPVLDEEWLTLAYPLPRPAQVSAGPLTIRSGPSTSTTPLGLLAVHQTVQVLAFSTDGAWSQIETPQPGWVNNRFLHFQSEGTNSHDTTVALTRGQIHSALANVYSGPGSEYTPIAALPSGNAIVVVATAVDSPWQEIAAPVHGWVRADMLDLEQETKGTE